MFDDAQRGSTQETSARQRLHDTYQVKKMSDTGVRAAVIAAKMTTTGNPKSRRHSAEGRAELARFLLRCF
jgi:hypothetical protein